MPIAIISSTLAVVGQHLVGLFGLLEFFLSLLVPRIAIRVVLHGQLAVGLLEFVLRRVFGNAKNLVIVTFCHDPGSSQMIQNKKLRPEARIEPRAGVRQVN